MGRALRVAGAGAAAAAVWAAADPLLRGGFGTRHTEVRLVGRMLAPETIWRPVGLAVHLTNGAIFAIAFDHAGGRGLRQAVAVAEVENALLWPLMLVVDRVHPDVRDGSWTALARDPRVFAHEAASHALFGAALGLLLPD